MGSAGIPPSPFTMSTMSYGIRRTSSKNVRLQPYDISKAPSRQPSKTPPLPPSNPPQAMKVLLLQTVSKLYPNIQPESDFAILQLAGGTYRHDQGDVRIWLDRQYNHLVQSYGGGEAGKRRLEAFVQKMMSLPPDQTIGLKPSHSAGDILVFQIPKSKYSFRLWPGSEGMKQYCLDFVYSSDTNQPVNSPENFTLWTTFPTVSSLPTQLMQISSLEEKMGVPRSKIRPGEERFVLVEGQHCLLKRPGFKDVSFMVPLRSSTVPLFPDADFIDTSRKPMF